MSNACKQFLLISSSVTPNGRLHLGHIGGPFLQLDVFARHQRQAGHQVMFCSAVDAYDSYVHFMAEEQGRPPAEIVAHFYPLLQQDLSALDIHLDHFINILEPHYAAVYRASAEELDQTIATHIGWSLHVENIGYRLLDHLPLLGRWVSGQCPVCQAETYGELCEGCGTLLSADRLINPIAEQHQAITWQQQQNVFAEIETVSLQVHVDRQVLPERVKSIAQSFLSGAQYRIRWTSYADWGLPYKTNQQQVFCHRGLLAAEQLMFGMVFQQHYGVMPFASSTDVISIQTFGEDNTKTFLLDTPALCLASGRYQPYSYHWGYPFLTLEGQKFSTSRQHAIWADEVDTDPALNSDYVRLYLLQCLARDQYDIDRQALYQANQKMAQYYADLLTQAEQLEKPYIHIAEIKAQWQQCFAMQAACLDPAAPDFAGFIEIAIHWTQQSVRTDERYDWLQGCAILLFPLMPRLAQSIWRALGRAGTPICQS